MVNAGTNHLGIDRSKTAGGRRRRMAANRKRQLREANLYVIVPTQYGLYRESGAWHLVALGAKRSEERLVSDRQGGTTSEVVENIKLTELDPTNGIVVSTFDTKRAATQEYYTPDSWNRIAPGKYWASEEDCGHKAFKVDRDTWRTWVR